MSEKMHSQRSSKEIIHQISTPLTNAMLGLEGLQEEPRLPQHELKWIVKEIKKVFEVLRTRDSHELLHHHQFSPDKIISGVVETYQKPYKVKCNFRSCPQKAVVYGHAPSFAEIVTHLLNNAAEAYHQNRSEREISIELISAMNGLNLIIGDNGQGISWWKKCCSFFRGVSFKKVKSGLGLARVICLVRREFGGKVQIVTLPKRGTMIIVHFPLN